MSETSKLDPANLGSQHHDQSGTDLDHVVKTGQCPRIQTAKLPEEMLLSICDYLESEDLLAFAEAWPKIADLIAKFNVIRTRELQCFCLKNGYMTSKLGIGVAVSKEEKGNMAVLGSEFDILSEDAFDLGMYYLRLHSVVCTMRQPIVACTNFFRREAFCPRHSIQILAPTSHFCKSLGESPR